MDEERRVRIREEGESGTTPGLKYPYSHVAPNPALSAGCRHSHPTPHPKDPHSERITFNIKRTRARTSDTHSRTSDHVVIIPHLARTTSDDEYPEVRC